MVEKIGGGRIKEVRIESDNEDDREQGEPGLERDTRRATAAEARKNNRSGRTRKKKQGNRERRWTRYMTG